MSLFETWNAYKDIIQVSKEVTHAVLYMFNVTITLNIQDIVTPCF